MDSTPTPTEAQFSAYEHMFRHFNEKLFGGKLPHCILNFSRKANTYGFFAPRRWQHDSAQDTRHEISLNPASLRSMKPIDVASTLVHEMVHLWQQEFGNPSRRGYHNAEWATKMDEVGLVPSSTGEPGGARVGQRMSDYVATDGPFDRAFGAMPSTYLLPWSCEEPSARKGPTEGRNKVKYTCDGCATNVWGKPGLTIVCGDCRDPFEEADSS